MAADTIEYITLRGFKSIASIDRLHLRSINVLIGPNGSGKSNFIGSFGFLRQLSEGKLQEYVMAQGGAEKVLHFGSKVTREVVFQISFRRGEDRDGASDFKDYKLILSPSTEDTLFPSGEVTFPPPIPLTPRAQGREAGISDRKVDHVAASIRAQLLEWRIYHFDDTSFSSPMRKTARVDDNRNLKQDGANLPAFLYLLRERHRSSYDLIVRTIRQVAPFFDDFRLEPLLLNPKDIKLEWRYKGSDQYFDAASLSDGTLRFIALAALFLQPQKFRRSVILLDEPELGLHPSALEILAALIRQASTSNQVIVSTQSSALLDHFQPDDVLVADLVAGKTELRRLEKDRLSRWLEDYSLGQLWEKNEIGGRPGSAS